MVELHPGFGQGILDNVVDHLDPDDDVDDNVLGR